MNVSDRPKAYRLLLSGFVLMLAFGSVPVSAAESSSDSFSSVSSDARPPSGIELQDAERALLFRDSRAVFQFNEYHREGLSLNGFYASLRQASLEAFALATDPASTRDELKTAHQRLNDFLSDNLYYEYGVTGISDNFLFELELQLHLYDEFGNEPGQWTEAVAEQFMTEIALVRDELYLYGFDSSGVHQTWRAHLNYLRVYADFEDRRNGRTEILEHTFRYRTDVLNRALTAQQTKKFDDAVQAIEDLWLRFGSQSDIRSAFEQLRSAYDSLPASGGSSTGLAADIEAARKLLDLPKGIRSGQYPASAFGDLKRAINEANLVLNRKSSTNAQFEQARSKLGAAVAHFRSRKKP